MAVIKNTLLFAGWIPTLFGGGVAVWWWESDKTIKDALTRTGLKFLKSEEEFERVYYEFEDDDNLFKDITDAKIQKGKAISEWCFENLKLSLNEKNVKEILPRTARYCMGNEKIKSSTTDFKNFSGITKFWEGLRELRNPIIAHLGENVNDDVYYLWDGTKESGEPILKKIEGRTRKDLFSRRISIGRNKFLPLGRNAIFELGNRLTKIFKKFNDKDKKNKLPGVDGNLSTLNLNSFINSCNKLINKDFDLRTEKEEYEKGKKNVMDWCIEEAYPN